MKITCPNCNGEEFELIRDAISMETVMPNEKDDARYGDIDFDVTGKVESVFCPNCQTHFSPNDSGQFFWTIRKRF